MATEHLSLRVGEYIVLTQRIWACLPAAWAGSPRTIVRPRTATWSTLACPCRSAPSLRARLSASARQACAR